MTNAEKFREVQTKMRECGLEIHRVGGKIIIQTPARAATPMRLQVMKSDDRIPV
jgi:hypothetical protein